MAHPELPTTGESAARQEPTPGTEYKLLPPGNLAIVKNITEVNDPQIFRFLIHIGKVDYYEGVLPEGVRTSESFDVHDGRGEIHVVINPLERGKFMRISLKSFIGVPSGRAMVTTIDDSMPHNRWRTEFVPTSLFTKQGFDLNPYNTSNNGRHLPPELSQTLYDFQVGQESQTRR